MACINLPAFPLQLLVKRHPEWKDLPAAVVDKDKPQGIIQWVNKRAMRFRILPGLRYAKGLSLSPDLRAGVVHDNEIQEHITQLAELFRFYTPHVEPSRHEPGVFWLDASGLSLLHPSLGKWAGLIGADLAKLGFYWAIAVGFSRYGTYAIAKSQKSISVFKSPRDEKARARAVPIVRLGIDPDLRATLEQLGITTLGGFVDLPGDGIRKRFGDDAFELYKLARGEFYTPLEARPPIEVFTAQLGLDHPETNTNRLLAGVEPSLQSIFETLEARGRLLTAVAITLTLDNGDTHLERLTTAAPTDDRRQVLGLVDLRLQTISLQSGVVDIALEAETVAIAHKQLELFAKRPCRDIKSTNQAFARLRAEFGDGAVMRAVLRDGHLPEASYEWEPMEKLNRPAPRKIQARNLVRRIYARSMALLSWPPGAKASNIVGPYVVSGGWWKRRVHREYYYVRNREGRWLWVYFDHRRKRAVVQGAVE